MNRELNFKVGQEVFAVKPSYMLRYIKRTSKNVEEWTYKITITKIGRKYLYTSDGDKYELKNIEGKLFLSLKDVRAEKVIEETTEYVLRYFDNYHLNKKLKYDQIERIYNILQED